MQLFTASRLSISFKLVVNFSIDEPNDFSRVFNRLKNIFEKPNEVATMALPADSISGSGISIVDTSTELAFRSLNAVT
jgi:hypothetical protein